MSRNGILTCAILLALSPQGQAHPNISDGIIHAGHYKQGMDLDNYWVSEKLDGIRAIWDGKTLYSKNGNVIHAPAWFVADLPNMHMEGELWAGRGQFHLVQQTVLDKVPNQQAWRKIDFMLFDLPQALGDYRNRYYDLAHWVRHLDVEHIKLVEHRPIESEQKLLVLLDKVDGKAGEGLMLRKANAHYESGRNESLLKVKKHQDAEAVVIGYKAGEGKYAGLLGSLHVRTKDGTDFYIGSGLKDALRHDPPPIGSQITFRFNGYTHTGIPRFARFIRIRERE